MHPKIISKLKIKSEISTDKINPDRRKANDLIGIVGKFKVDTMIKNIGKTTVQRNWLTD